MVSPYPLFAACNPLAGAPNIRAMTVLPGGPIASRPLHFIWLLDCSGSMAGEKIQQLNFAIREAIPAMQDTARDNPNAQVLVRVVTFASGAKWHVANPTPIESFTWTNVQAGGVTDMGRALHLVSEQMRTPPMSERALPPVLVLITDGQPTDDFNSGLQALLAQPWGSRAVRLAIAVGDDADHAPLIKFIGNSEMQPLQANNAPTLVNYIRWASTAVLKAASTPQAPGGGGNAQGGVQIPTAAPAAATTADTW